VSASVGGFQNRGTFGNDRAVFAGVALESQLAKGLHLSAWVRQGDMVASLTRLDQRRFTPLRRWSTACGSSTWPSNIATAHRT